MKVRCLCGEKRITDFMRAFDMCEADKIFAKFQSMEVTLKPGVSDQQAVSDLRTLMDQTGYYVALIVCDGLTWRNPDVKLVSDGQKWFLLDDLMELVNEDSSRIC